MKRIEKAMWQLERNVAVFVNSTFLGDDAALVTYVGRKFQFQVYLDWSEIGQCHLVECLKNIMTKFVKNVIKLCENRNTINCFLEATRIHDNFHQ